MVDASHGNSERDHQRQPTVAREVAAQVSDGERGIFGLMLESFLVAGRQELSDPAKLTYGQSITDACIGWDETDRLLRELAQAVRDRRVRGPGGTDPREASASGRSGDTRSHALSRSLPH